MSGEIDHGRRRFLATTAMTIAAAQFGMIGSVVQQATAAGFQLSTEGELPSLGATSWLNSQPLRLSAVESGSSFRIGAVMN
jgi:hypothetical protein